MLFFKGISRFGLLATLLGCTFFVGCVADSDLLYLNDKVNKVEQRIGALEQNMKRQGSEELVSVKKNIADTNYEVERLKRELEGLKASVEEMKVRRIAKLETSNQGLLSRISDLEADMAQVRGQLKLEPRPEAESKQLNLGQPSAHEPRPPVGRTPQGGAKESTQPVPPALAGIAPSQERQPQVQTKEPDPLEQGIELFKKGNTKEAIPLFDGIIKGKGTEDKKPEAYYWMGECYMAQKDYEKAILTYQDLIKNYPQSPRVPNALLRQAEAFAEIKDKMSAIIIYRQVIKKYPGTQEAKKAESRLQELEKKKQN
jgi:tol-pal system protein YbgF